MSIVRVPFSLTGGAGGYVIKGSGLFDGGYLYQTPSAGDSNQVFTMEIVGKHTFVPSGADDHLFTAGTDTSNYWDISWTTTGALQIVLVESGGIVDQIITTPLYRDFGAFYQIVIGVDKTAAASDDRYTIEYNGTAITSFSTNTREAAGGDTFVGKANVHVISAFVDLARNAYDYLSRFTYIDGTKLDATSFGELDNNGGWSLLNVSGLTFGTNGWLIEGGTDMAAGLDSRDVSTQITASGAYIGDMTNNGGLAAAFDGITSQASTASAASPSQTTAYCGQDEGAGNSATVTKVKVYGPNNTAPFDSNDRTIELYGSNTSPASDTDGTLIASGIYQGQVSAIGYINAPSNTTAYRYHWVRFVGSGSNAWYAAEVQFYEGDSGGPSWFVEGTITAINDSPTDDAANGYGNHATFNPLRTNTISASPTYSNGNRSVTNSAAGSATYSPYTTIVVNAGKFYAEIAPNTFANDEEIIGMALNSWDQWEASNQLGASSGSVGLHTLSTADTKIKINGGTLTTVDTKMVSPDRTVLAADVDAGMGWLGFYDDSAGVIRWVDSSGTTRTTDEPGNGTNATWTFTANSVIKFGASIHSGGDVDLYAEKADWVGTAPSGFKALSTANLPAPTVTDPSAYFKTLLYTGNSTGSTAITGCQDASGTNWTPDLVWIKPRTFAADGRHCLYDQVRGANKRISSNNTNAEATDIDCLDSFDSGGFTLGADTANNLVNDSGYTYVAWCLNAGGSGSSNTDGTITSTVSAAAHGGFSIGTYTGTGSNATVGHGLDRTPSLYIVKDLDNSTDWFVYNETSGATKYLKLNTIGAETTSSIRWNDTAPTSSVFSLGTSADVNGSGADFVFYAFARTPGLIGIGSYTGNGSADGPYVVVDDGASGFRPAFFLVKVINTTQNWFIFDSARNTYNEVDLELYANLSAADSSRSPGLDFVANGVKLRTSYPGINASGDTFIYLAFAEYPFGGAGVEQARAR